MPERISKLPNRGTPLEDIIEEAITQGANEAFINKIIKEESVKPDREATEASVKFLITVIGWLAKEGIDWKVFGAKAKEEGEPFGHRIAPSLILAAKAFSHKLALKIYALGVALGFVVFPKVSIWDEKEDRWVTLVK